MTAAPHTEYGLTVAPDWDEISKLKNEFNQAQERAMSGQKKSRNVPPRPKQKRKPKGRKTHRL